MKEHLNVAILAVTILLAVVIYVFCTRYQIVAVGGEYTRGFQINRITGETWILGPMGNKKIKHEEAEPSRQ